MDALDRDASPWTVEARVPHRRAPLEPEGLARRRSRSRAGASGARAHLAPVIAAAYGTRASDALLTAGSMGAQSMVAHAENR